LEQFPLLGSQESVVQGSLSPQFLAVLTHPEAATHESVVQALLSSQSVGVVPALQLPLEQVSPVVHALLSLQLAVFGVWMQAPLFGLQVSLVQTLKSLQAFGPPAAHTPPPAHLSATVHSLPSSQGVPTIKFCFVHWIAFAALQKFMTQPSTPYLQGLMAIGTQIPPEPESDPSSGSHVPSHVLELAVGRQAAPSATPGTHEPAWQ
jgi:hypothetical protein